MTMTISRRSTLETLGAVGAGSAMTGSALAVDEHETDDGDGETSGDDGPEAVAAVRVAHFSSDAPAVDVYLDDDRVLSDVSFGEISSYLEVEPGTAAVRITAAGDPETVVFDDEVAVGRAFYTIAAIGTLGDETFRPLVLTDAGSTLVRLRHAAADAPAVSVTADDGQLSLYEAVSFGDVTDYVALPAGQYTLEVSEAGDDTDSADHEGERADDTAPITTFDVDLERGGAYTAYAVGDQGSADEAGPLSVTVVEDGPTAG